MIRIAIDGPGGAGKSSLAKAVAKELGIVYVDTGALYRTIGLFMLKNGIAPKDAPDVIGALNSFTLEMKFEDGKQVILLDGEDVGDTIRTPEVSMAASAVSAIPEVREFLLNTQRDIARKHSVIMDGRDIGTVILPDAEVKIFLTASPEARAKRRYDELIAKGKDVKYEDVYREMVERDTNDSTRAVAPCVPADDAIHLDNSNLTAEGTVKAVLKIIKKNEKRRKTSYMKAKVVLGPFFKFLYGVRVHGEENIPSDGGYLVCSNHIAIRDVLVLGASAPRQLRFIAKKEAFRVPILRGILKAWGAVKIDRGGNDVGAIRTSIDLVNKGNIVAIFPQGHRYPGVDPKTTEVKNGAGLIAYRAGCGVIPAFIKVKGNKYGLFKKVDVFFGKPLSFEELGFEKGGNEEYKKATELIFDRIVSLDSSRMISSHKSKERED